MQKSQKPHEPETEHHDHEDSYFSSNGGPYIYEHGSLKQKTDVDPKIKEARLHHENIRMDNEHYEIELIFEVAANNHNYERGNIYL